MKKLLALAVCLGVASLSLHGAGLTEAARLAAVHDLILQTRFEDADRARQAACPPAPVEACQALAATSLWWQIQFDPESTALDRQIEELSLRAIAAAERWTVREPTRAEAWFYLAAAAAPLTEWRVMRGERLRAARDGLTIKNALDQALALDPTLKDAYFGIGLYHYYAAIAPASLRMLRWLLLLPGGDREQGLREMLEARDGGVLLRGEADYQLHRLYLWYEHQPDRAVELLRDLASRYPSNAIFFARIAEVERDGRHDTTATSAAWQTLLDRARNKTVEHAAIAETWARLGLAETMSAPAEAAHVVALLTPLIEMKPSAPSGSYARACFELGRVYDRLGDRAHALSSLAAAIENAPRDDASHIRDRAREELARMRSTRR